MTIKPVEFYVAACNGCGKHNEHEEFAAWSDRGGAEDAAASDDWRSHEDQHWCPGCQHCEAETGHVPDDYGDCARCGEELDDDDDPPSDTTAGGGEQQ